MKKYKDLEIHIGTDAQSIEALVQVENYCTKVPFEYSEEIEKMYMPDDKMAHILVRLPKMPKSVLLLWANEGKLKVINVVPNDNKVFKLTKDQYNQIIDEFEQQIILPLFGGKYEIEKTQDEININDTIPHSFEFLSSWASCPGAPGSPFSHPNDLERWFEFLCQLRKTGEYLSSGDLEQWLLEDKNWSAEVVEDTIIRYETEMELLDYYDKHKQYWS